MIQYNSDKSQPTPWFVFVAMVSDAMVFGGFTTAKRINYVVTRF